MKKPTKPDHLPTEITKEIYLNENAIFTDEDRFSDNFNYVIKPEGFVIRLSKNSKCRLSWPLVLKSEIKAKQDRELLEYMVGYNLYYALIEARCDLVSLVDDHFKLVKERTLIRPLETSVSYFDIPGKLEALDCDPDFKLDKSTIVVSIDIIHGLTVRGVTRRMWGFTGKRTNTSASYTEYAFSFFKKLGHIKGLTEPEAQQEFKQYVKELSRE